MEKCRGRANFNNSLSPRANTSLFQTQPPSSQISLSPKPPTSSFIQDSSELSIFDARSYFDGNQQNTPKKTAALDESCNDISTTNPRASPVSSVDGYSKNWRNGSFHATPTASSEASWNSQSGLLSNPQGCATVGVKACPSNEKGKKGSPSFSASRRFFRHNCPCYGKKSVDVQEKYSEPRSPIRVSSVKPGMVSNITAEVKEGTKMKITAGMWAKDSTHRIVNPGFSFPILAPPRPPEIPAADDPARGSLEVFQLADELTTIRRSAEFPRRPPAATSGDNDVASDTSSDLFEIESFSTNSAYRRRDSLDEYPKVMDPAAAIGILQFRRSMEEMTECYAPSEVSVEWSVTTAEGGFDRASQANFSSAASDFAEAQFTRNEPGRSKKKGGGGLMSCRCENSVNVGPSPVQIEPGRGQVGRTVPFGIEPEISRFALQKAELVRSSSARRNRAVQIR